MNEEVTRKRCLTAQSPTLRRNSRLFEKSAKSMKEPEFVDTENMSMSSKSDNDDGSNYSDEESEQASNRRKKSAINPPTHDLEIRLLKQWAIQHQIPHHQLRQLFAILRVRLLPNLSKSVKEFLGIRRVEMTPSQIQESLPKKQKLVENVTESPLIHEILKRLVSIEATVNKNRESLANIEESLHSREDFVTAEFSIPKNHEIELPIGTIDGLKLFEQKLVEDSKCLSDTLQVMKRLKSSKLSISATSILRKFISRHVAVQYTATKKMSDKFVLEAEVPKFLGCILEALMACHEGTSEKEAKSAVGSALTQSKGWDGQRSLGRRDEHNSTPGPTASSGRASVSTNDPDGTEIVEPKEEIMDVESIILNSFAPDYIDSSDCEFEH